MAANPADRLDSSPLHARRYADGALFVSAPISENVRVARDTYRVRFEAPELASRITPGQFVMIRLAGFDDPMLGRAFALYDVVRDPSGAARWIDVVYLVHGKLTTALAQRQPGDTLEVWGPLGNGFAGTEHSGDRLVLVAGGIGQTPFLACGREALGHAAYGEATHGAKDRRPLRSPNVTLCYGVRTADYLAGEADFLDAGIDLRIASDDGSVGHHGLVTDLLKNALEENPDQKRRVACCGPEPMMAAVAKICHEAMVPCEVSLETPMACGVGVCFSCVAKVTQPDGEWDYKRTCVEGPIFDANKIVW